MPFPIVESSLLVGIWSIVLALVTVGILWNARDRAVYCWGLSGVLGGLYICLASPWTSAAFYDSLAGQWILPALVVTAGLLKLMAVGLLANRDSTVGSYWRLVAAVGTAVVVAPLVMPERRWVSFFTLGLVIALMVLFVLRAYSFGRALRLNNAKFFAGLIGVQIAMIFLGAIVFLINQGDPLLPNSVPQTLGSVLFSLVVALLNNALFITLVLDVNVLRADAAQQQLLQAAEVRSRHEERERMLADMHDGLGSQLATARLKVERGQMLQPEVAELLRECMADLHLMVDTLRDQGNSLATALVDYRFRTERRVADRDVSLDWQIDLDAAPAMPATTLLQVLRIVQEALNNAIKHSQASRVVISACYSATAGCKLRVEDEGIGLPDPLTEGRGLSSMRRRARDIGGSLRIERVAEGGGTVVELSLPPTTAGTPA